MAIRESRLLAAIDAFGYWGRDAIRHQHLQFPKGILSLNYNPIIHLGPLNGQYR